MSMFGRLYREEDYLRDRIFDYAMRLLRTPYIWAGNDPYRDGGLDCSGFHRYIYESFGLIPFGSDYNCMGFYKLWSDKQVVKPVRGGFVLYGESREKITHMMLTLDSKLCLGATGGGSTTGTVEESRARGAYVRQLPINYRKDIICYVDPIKT